jgi:hypothetical protein
LTQRFEQKNPFFFKKLLKKEKALQQKAKGLEISWLPGQDVYGIINTL